MKLAKPVLFALLIVFVSMVQAQYFNEQVLEKSFEKTDFFYHPYYLNPYGISGFGDVAPGLLDDPLLNLQLNPAYTVSDSVNRYYIYVDFRNSRNVADDEPYEPWRIYSSSMWMDCLPYSYYHTQKRTDLEPVFSGACLFRPFQLKNQWTVGITYQIVSKDEAFYHIPQDIYRSNIGYDYNGYAVAEGGYMPIIDRYQGSDEMHHEGHFLSILTGIRLMPRLDIGFQFSRVLFDRTGILGSENIQNRMWYHDNDLYQRDLLERWQDYAHWDISGGVNYRYNHKSILGVGAGYLKGSVKQWLNQQSQYDYSYGMENEGQEWSHYFQSGDTEQDWDHDGRTLYGNIHLKAPLTAQNTIHLAYRFLKEDVDIDLFSNVLDTSYSNYHYAYDEWMNRIGKP